MESQDSISSNYLSSYRNFLFLNKISDSINTIKVSKKAYSLLSQVDYKTEYTLDVIEDLVSNYLKTNEFDLAKNILTFH